MNYKLQNNILLSHLIMVQLPPRWTTNYRTTSSSVISSWYSYLLDELQTTEQHPPQSSHHGTATSWMNYKLQNNIILSHLVMVQLPPGWTTNYRTTSSSVILSWYSYLLDELQTTEQHHPQSSCHGTATSWMNYKLQNNIILRHLVMVQLPPGWTTNYRTTSSSDILSWYSYLLDELQTIEQHHPQTSCHGTATSWMNYKLQNIILRHLVMVQLPPGWTTNYRTTSSSDILSWYSYLLDELQTIEQHHPQTSCHGTATSWMNYKLQNNIILRHLVMVQLPPGWTTNYRTTSSSVILSWYSYLLDELQTTEQHHPQSSCYGH